MKLARLQILLAAALFSTGGAAIKFVTLTGVQVACLRSAIAAVTILIVAPAARRIRDPRVLLVGAAYAATMILFVLSNKLTTAANSIFLQSTAPLYILLLGPWLLHERIRPRDVALIGIVGVALLPFVLTTDVASATAPNPARGNLVAMLSGLTWAGTVVGMRWLGQTSPGGQSAFATVLAGNLLAFAVCLPFALPLGLPSATDWAVVGYLGVFQIGIAYLCLTAGIRAVPALEASVLLLVEPALNPLWAWVVQHERPNGWALVGGATILGAGLVKARWDDREPLEDPVRNAG